MYANLSIVRKGKAKRRKRTAGVPLKIKNGRPKKPPAYVPRMDSGYFPKVLLPTAADFAATVLVAA